jgi:hypothetical protein
MIPILFVILAAERGIHFEVTDTSGRAVTGLDKSAFTIRENGFARECLRLANPESDLTVVVLTDTAVVGSDTVQSLDEARKRLAASSSARKVLIIATQAAPPLDLGRVLVLYRSNGESAVAAAEAMRSRYVLYFESNARDGSVDIAVQTQRRFPALKAIR